MEYITIALNFDKKASLSYVTRGEIYMAKGNLPESLSDFSFALLLNENLKEAYVNRALCYRKLAETEEDPTKKAELIAIAEADEKKAEALEKDKE